MPVRRVTVLGTAVLSILLGILYAFRAFGPTEAEVVLWGQFCLLGGLLALIVGVPKFRFPSLLIPEVIGFGVLAASQLLPIVMWFSFHGRPISDGIPPSSFQAHWAWAIPHILLLLAAAACAVTVWKDTRAST
jgi:hypothetical protein